MCTAAAKRQISLPARVYPWNTQKRIPAPQVSKKPRLGMLKKIIVVFAFAIGCRGAVSAEIVRQESTNGLRKVVYTVPLAECEQQKFSRADEGDGWSYYREDYWAIVPVPELRMSGLPMVQILCPRSEARFFSELSPAEGWVDVNSFNDDGSGDVVMDEQKIYIRVKSKTKEILMGEVQADRWITHHTQVKILVVCEPQNQDELKVLNTGTGKSLALGWGTNAPNAKVEGYKVYRRRLAD